MTYDMAYESYDMSHMIWRFWPSVRLATDCEDLNFGEYLISQYKEAKQNSKNPDIRKYYNFSSLSSERQ